MLRKLKVNSGPVALRRLLRVQSVWGVAEMGIPFGGSLQGLKMLKAPLIRVLVLRVYLRIHRYIGDADFRLPNTSNLM